MEDFSALIAQVAETVEKTALARFARPTATYRLQFVPEVMTFGNAASLVPYLDALGISHLYGSPCLRSRSGETSGYSVVDYSQLHPALGSPQDYANLVEELHHRGMGQILDMVPNHMSALAAENRWWNDVLENGPSSPYAHYFDIDWSPINEALEGKILLPLLGDQYGKILEAGELKLEYHEGSFFINYYALRLPLDPQTYRQILSWRLEEFRETLPADSEDLRELESIVTALEHLPARTETAPASIAERQREKEVVKGRLEKLTVRAPALAEFILRNVQEFNGRIEDPHSFDRLDTLLDSQVYRLSHWKAAADEINYRRFFDINELAAVCMEQPKVFEESHHLIFELLVRGDADGLRIDHIDGLFDPHEYLYHLQWGYLRNLGRAIYQHLQKKPGELLSNTLNDHTGLREGEPRLREGEAPAEPSVAPQIPATLAARQEPRPPETAKPNLEFALLPTLPDWKDFEPSFLREMSNRFDLEIPLSDPAFSPPPETVQIVGITSVDGGKLHQLPLYVIVEKILGPEEPIPQTWPVAGTTGYDFANFVGGLFIDPAGFAELQKTHRRFIDEEMNFREVAYQSKSLILRMAMSSDLQLLVHRLNRLSERHRHYRDFTLNELRMALREIIACFPVYRTYIRQGEVSEQDRQFIVRAVAQAKRRNPTRHPALFDFIRDVLLLETPPDLDEAGMLERAMFVGRFQQATSPVMAKGIEDTAFYRYFPLVSLDEVGGDPARPATSLEEFHRQNLMRQSKWPLSLTCTSTHDTKRSEDVRARIDVLSEIPTEWRAAVNRWSRLNRRHRREVDGQPAPSRNDEYLFYQNLIGIWPLAPPDAKTFQALLERMQLYMEKATREAKLHTSWLNPVADYDAALREFTAGVLRNNPKNRFLADFRGFHEQIVNWGLQNALSQIVLKLTSPGVPDIYQGQELWDFSLVDPDNRRPVDFTIRQNLLKQLEEAVGHNEESLFTLARELAANPRDPRLKLFVTWRVLQFRRLHAELFERGEYIPLKVEGMAAQHLCAFARRLKPTEGNPPTVVVAVPRRIAQLMKAANDVAPTSPPLGTAVWRGTLLDINELGNFSPINLFTGQPCPIKNSHLLAADLLADFPVAVLVNAE